MIRVLYILLTYLFSSTCFAQVFQPEWLESKNVESRYIQVYRPSGTPKETKLPVLYMHDGQNLFDSKSAYGGVEWGIDETLDSLILNKIIRPVMVVGIWNNGAYRRCEYFPEKALPYLNDSLVKMLYANELKGNPLGSEHLKFIVTELKPYIDSNYATLPDMKNTFIGGSSMGGLSSTSALLEYPDVFSAAICFSTHWPGCFSIQGEAVPLALRDYIFNQEKRKFKKKFFYYDCGDQTLDSLYPPLQEKADLIFHLKKVKRYYSLRFPGTSHNEASWSKRFHIPVIKLLGKKRRKTIRNS
jgi:predicted alpha/beta superfamily hydrolase